MAELQEEAAEAATVPSDKNTERLRKLASEYVETDLEILSLKEELEKKNKRKSEIAFKELPDLMSEIKQDKIGLPDFGDFGADVVSEPYYHANIASDWPDEKREEAFEHLDELDSGDIIKNVVTLQFPRGQHEAAKKFVMAARSLLATMHIFGVEMEQEVPDPVVEMTVPWNTLTSWLKEQIQNGVAVDLEKIGGTVGTIAKIKYRKD